MRKASPRTLDPATDPRQWLEENTALLRAIVGKAVRQRRSAFVDADELFSLVCARLVQDDYRALRQFRGSSHIATYLAVLVKRVLLDWQIAHWGKWRPSARARALGPSAVALERLVVRDGQSLVSALRTLSHSGTPENLPADTARQLVAASVWCRRTFVTLENVDVGTTRGDDPLWQLLERDRGQSKAHLLRRLTEAVNGLGVADRQLLTMRHHEGLKVGQMAARVGTNPKRLYRRLDRVYRTLRARLEREGLSDGDAEDALRTGWVETPRIFEHASTA
jgi:RNA polymerase sigma factor (sigma-70 family)